MLPHQVLVLLDNHAGSTIRCFSTGHRIARTKASKGVHLMFSVDARSLSIKTNTWQVSYFSARNRVASDYHHNKDPVAPYGTSEPDIP